MSFLEEFWYGFKDFLFSKEALAFLAVCVLCIASFFVGVASAI